MTSTAPDGLIDCPMLRTVSGRPTDYWNDSCALEELEYAVARGATGATSNPSIVLEVLGKETVVLDAADRGAGRGKPDLDRDRDHLGRDRGDGRPRRRRARAGLRARGRAQGPPVDADEPGQLPEHRTDARAGDPLREPRPEHPGQVPGDAGRDRWRSSRRPRPASASMPRSASRSPRRSPSPRRSSAGWMRWPRPAATSTAVTPVCTIMVGRLDDWMRVLVERDDIAVHPDALDWAGIAAFKRAVADLPRARLPDTAAGRRLPAPPPLDRAGGRGRRADDDPRLAGALQRQRDRPRVTDRRAGRPGDRRRAARARSPTSGAPTSRTA